MPAAPVVKAQTFDAKAYSIMKRVGSGIVMGAYAARQRLPDTATLAEKMSATPDQVIAAMTVLFAKRLIKLGHNNALVVNDERGWNNLDTDVLHWRLLQTDALDALLELLQLRAALEPEASALAALIANAEQRQDLRQKTNALMHAIASSTVTAQHFIHVHHTILSATCNRFFVCLEPVVATVFHHMWRLRSSIMFDPEKTAQRLDGIVEKILVSDAQAAKKLHLELLDDIMWSALGRLSHANEKPNACLRPDCVEKPDRIDTLKLSVVHTASLSGYSEKLSNVFISSN
jgi:DNA-binding FadR family transcriptional regulator